jgi:PPOX class probable F420-dependent enzyme
VSDDAPTVPDDLVYLLTSGRLGHVSAIRADGSIAMHLMWIDWDGRHVLTSSPMGSVKGQNWRRNPQVAVSAVDEEDPWRFVIVRGRVTDIRPDADLAFIDKMSLRYLGVPYRRRDYPREVFEITPDYIQASPGRGGRR